MVNWGGKWRKTFKDYPETYMSGHELIAKDSKNLKEFQSIREIIREGLKETYDIAYKHGFSDGKNAK